MLVNNTGNVEAASFEELRDIRAVTVIVVSGATGTLGRQVVEQLLELVAPERVAAGVRDPAAADRAPRAPLTRCRAGT